MSKENNNYAVYHAFRIKYGRMAMENLIIGGELDLAVEKFKKDFPELISPVDPSISKSPSE